MGFSRSARALISSVFAFSFCPSLFGQATGTISGMITDATGAAVSGAKIKVSGESTGTVREAVSDSAGHYVVPLLGVSSYAVRAEFTGFQPNEVKNIRLQVDEQREVDFTLSPANVQQSVEVNATAVAVQTSNPTLGQVITSQQVAELPLNGRDFVQLATLTPGTTQETNPNSFFNGGASSEVSARGSFSLSVGGSRANSTDWLLDGNDNNELTGGGIGILPSIDAIQEFKVLTYNYSAEWGTRAGPTVLVTTKSGTDTVHGTIFEFFRNTKLDARSFFASNTEQFNLNQFGGSIGGPIKKDKTFIFADIQNKFQRHGIPFTGLVPSVAQRTGDFTNDAFGNPFKGLLVNPNIVGVSADTAFQCGAGGNPLPVNANGTQAKGFDCNKIPSGLINPITQKLINLYPLPNANNSALGYNYVNEPVRKLNEGEFDGRLDHNFSNNDYAFARFSYDQAVSYVPGGSPGFAEADAFGSNQGILNHGRNVALSETHVFSPNTVNQINGGYNRIFDYITSQGTGSCLASKIGIPGANLGGVSCGLTSTQLDGGYWSLGDRGYSPFQGGTNVFSVSDSLDMVRGNHDIKIGMGFRANQMNVLTEAFGDGYWIYSGLWSNEPAADLLLGLPSLAIHDQTFNGTTTGRRWKLYRPYAEDSWRVSKDLTLNLGLAWALVTPITEAHNRQADFDPATGKFLIAGQGASSSAGIQMDKTAFEPRLGVAWKPFGSHTTAIRGGYAIFHDSSWNQGAQGLWQNPPYFAESDRFAFGGACTFATAACATVATPSAISASDGFQIFTAPPVPANFTGTIQAQNLNFKQGRVQQFNINVEHQLPGQVLLTVGYAGSRSSHILVDGNNLNISSPSACGAVSGYTLGCGPNGAAFGVPYTAFPFSTVSATEDVGRAHYNSLQIKAETKSSHGLYAILGYTYSKAYDNGLSDGLGSLIGATYFPLPNWQNLDWGLSQINLNHNFTASVIYDLPFGKGKKYGSGMSSAANMIVGGWELTVIEKANSGFPIFVVDSGNNSGVNFSNNGNSLIRPNQTCNPNSGTQTLAAFFKTSCFSAPLSGEIGNANRTPVSGPNFINTDFSVIKNFPIRESFKLQFRSEFFNLFNHAQFGQPGNDIAAGNFGAISTTVGNPRVVQFALKAAFLRFLFALLLATSIAAAPSRRKIIINEDCSGPGGSNMQTVLLLLQSPAVEVLGITIVSGDQWRDEEVAHTLRLLEIIGRTDIPVMLGANAPLIRTRQETLLWQERYGKVAYSGAWDARWWHEADVVPHLPEGQPTVKPSTENAIQFLIRKVHEFPNEVTIYEGGPMTNLAIATTIDPQFPQLAEELVFMGGSLEPQSDNPEFVNNPRHEFNFWFDPEAAHIVLRAPWKKIVCTPTDISIKARLTPALAKKIGESGTPIGRYIAKYYQSGDSNDYMWDELAAAAWIDPSIITRKETRFMSVDIDHGFGYGNTITWHNSDKPKLTLQPVEIQCDLDTAKFLDMFLSLMTRP